MFTPDDLKTAAFAKRFDETYERYGKPLESEHMGEYLAVSPSGECLLESDRSELARVAAERFGPGVFLYKIGTRSVGAFRSPRRVE